MGIDNILKKDKLIKRINYNALFILNFESLKDFLVDKVRDFFTSKYEIRDGELVGIPDDKYNKEIRILDKECDIASLNWLKSIDAISDLDIDIYVNLKKNRNEITHKFYDTLYRPIEEKDITQLNLMIDLYSRIDKWFINNIYIPTDESMMNVDYDENEVIGGQELILQIVNNAIQYNDYTLLNDLMAELNKVMKK